VAVQADSLAMGLQRRQAVAAARALLELMQASSLPGWWWKRNQTLQWAGGQRQQCGQDYAGC
jgi:hypothetical protein